MGEPEDFAFCLVLSACTGDTVLFAEVFVYLLPIYALRGLDCGDGITGRFL